MQTVGYMSSQKSIVEAFGPSIIVLFAPHYKTPVHRSHSLNCWAMVSRQHSKMLCTEPSLWQFQLSLWFFVFKVKNKQL